MAVSRSQLFNFAVLPLVMVIFFGLRVVAQTHPEIDAWIPKWDRLLLFAVVILLERIYHYRYAVSQRYVLTRDTISNIVKSSPRCIPRPLPHAAANAPSEVPQ